MPTRQGASRQNTTARTAFKDWQSFWDWGIVSLNKAKKEKTFSFFSFVTCGG
jgi:hypothetical protein